MKKLTVTLILIMLSTIFLWAEYPGTGTFNKISDVNDLESGAYYVFYGINGSNTGAMKNTGSSRLGSESITVVNDQVVDPSTAIVWLVTGNSTDGYTVYNEAINKYAEIVGNSTSGFALNEVSTHQYVVTNESTGLFFQSNHASAGSRGISIYKTDWRPYVASGAYTLELYKFNSGGTTPTALTADFSANTTSGTVPLTVNFTPNATGGTSPYSYAWDFDNNGTTDSTDENPEYIYETVGDYSVKLTVTDSALGTDAEEKIDYITVNAEPVVGDGVATDLFFSEYIEGSSFNKAIEIFNGTGASVDLSIYTLKKGTNGADFSMEYTLSDAVATLANNDVVVLTHSDSNAEILAASDANAGVINFNGDDAMGLFKNGTLIDIIGLTTGTDPGTGWEVAGVNNGTANHSLVRKSTVSAPTTDWATSAGTNETDSQWIVNNEDDASNLGIHTFDGVAVEPGALSVDFSADVTSGNPSLTVNFTNLVTGGTSPYIYSWDFDNDGTEDSSDANPTFTYTSVGTYTVSLYVIDNEVNDATEIKTAYITVTEAGSYEGYYEDITATGGEALKTQLANLISTNTNSSYDGSREQMYGYIDNINGHVTCVYTGLDVNHGVANTGNPSGLNCEHSYPQSWIEDYAASSDQSKAKADVHHLFPTESSSNSSRSNLSFDDVVSVTNTWTEVTGYASYRGTNADGVIVFEVADQHKGDTARAMLYMNVRYDLPLSNESRDLNINMLPTLLAWHGEDPVDNAEITRNDGIEDYQSNRNPFVDHPEWVSAVYGGVSVDTCIKPVMNPAGATFDAVQNVTITTTTAGASIYYTTDGTTPSSASTPYSGAIEVANDMTIKAIAVKADFNDSQVATEAYVIDIVLPVSIYDIQYATSYPYASSYLGQTVNVTGIVTAVDGNSFYLSAPAGGAWNSVFVYNSGQNPAIGDNVTFNAEVDEYATLTELKNVTNYSTISSNNSVTPTVINTNQYDEEAYESVLVTLQNATVTIAPDSNNEWYVSDGSGDALLDNEFYYPETAPLLGNVYSSITGVVNKTFDGFRVSPRFEADVVLDTQANQVPIISNVAYSPALVYADDIVTVTADVVDNDGTLATVNLKWGTATGSYTTTTPMTLARAGYNANIPAQTEGSVIYYVVEATDDESDTTTSEEASYTVLAEPGEGVATDLFFSEYIEGGGYNKALEIYNGTGAPVDLSIYTIKYSSNGAAYGDVYTLSDAVASLASNDVVVLAHSTAASAITDEADATPGIINHNGNDGYGLFKNDVLIDVIGTPGGSWSVAGTSNGTKDHTLVRKSSINAPTTDWALSAGTSEATSQWIVYGKDDTSYIGSHVFDFAGSTPTVVATPAITPVAGEYNNQVEVTIATTTADATIYYTIDGTDPTTASDVYSEAFTLTADATVKAYATKAELDDSAIAEAVYTIVTVVETVETPVITPATGTYYAEQSVTIETATADATIYYTLDGTDPTTTSSVYSEALVVTATTTVKAYAVKAGWTDSALAESVITIEELNYTPGMIISEYIEGTSNNKALEIYNGTGAEVDLTPYTVQKGSNGGTWASTCDMTGTLAAGDVFVITNSDADDTIDAVSDVTNTITYFNGNDAVGLFFGDLLIDVIGTFDDSSTSDFDVAGVSGAGKDHTLVRKNTVTVGNTNWATSAGTDATDSQWVVHPVNTFTYLGFHGIDVTATPEISPDGGSYTDEVEITITCPTDGATIYYTLDGNDPTASSTEYTAPFTLLVDTTVKAIAMKADYEDSAIASAEYTIIDSGDVPTGMIISEYLEGGSNNKAIEIYNGTGEEVDLTPYIVKLGSNGGTWGNTCDMVGTLAAGEVFILANAGSDAAILALADTLSTITYFNGDDAVGLFYNEVLIDLFGVYQTDPGTGWEVAGVTNATVDRTLVRKLTVTEGTTDWATSAGTDATDSQWVVYPTDTFDMLGSHTAPLDVVTAPVISPDGGDYQDDVVVSITTTTADANIYYTLDGSTPTDASTLYSTSFTLTEDATVKAIAMKTGFVSSTMTVAVFTVTQVTFDDGFTISETEMTFTSEVGVESEIQSYTLYMQGSTLALVEVTGDFQIMDTEGAWGTDFFFELDEEEVTINVKFNATTAGTVYGEITHTSDDFDDDFVISLTGTATEVTLTSIYDIQFPTDLATSDASPYDGQEVLVEGVVTVTNYKGLNYFISSPTGGAWNSIYVYDSINQPTVGDIVSFKAVVDEYYGWTELKTITEYTVISQGNPVPAPIVLTTAELASMEAYESVLVTIEDVTVTVLPNNNKEWFVTDGSGDAQIDDNIFELLPVPALGDAFVSITGVVDYSYDEYGLNPRSEADFVIGGGVTELDTPVITSITKVATGIEIIWGAVDNANSYNVYVADTPDGQYSPAGSTSTTSFNYNATEGMKFFYIEASTDGVLLKK